VHFSAEGAAVATPVIDRGDLDALWRAGPFVVEEYEGTLVVPPGSRASLDEFGTIVIEVSPS
jgi:N-methylhydantoinase A